MGTRPVSRRDALLVGGTSLCCAVASACVKPTGPAPEPTTSSTPPTSSTSAPATWPPWEISGRPADANGIQLPEGFQSRVVAVVGQPVAATGYLWPANPDGAAAFADPALPGGWLLAVNSEVGSGRGGVSSLRFGPDGAVTEAFAVLSGTSVNCAGGATPWDTWLSCEEIDRGLVYECDPARPSSGIARGALGRFVHEAAVVDAAGRHVYMTEDRPDGRLYRFTPGSWPSLSTGNLEVAVLAPDKTVGWLAVPDPTAAVTPCRYQVPESTPFDGGEGIALAARDLWFTTKGDNRVWQLDLDTARLTILYDASSGGPLRGVDNLQHQPARDLLWVAEDGGDMEVVVLDRGGRVAPFLKFVGHDGSEVTGLAFTPDGSRLFLSSQRGAAAGGAGITYEISGPFVAS